MPSTRDSSRERSPRDTNSFIIHFNNEKISFIHEKDFSFLDLDSWIRSRFAIKSDTRLKYANEDGQGTYVNIKSHMYTSVMIFYLL